MTSARILLLERASNKNQHFFFLKDWLTCRYISVSSLEIGFHNIPSVPKKRGRLKEAGNSQFPALLSNRDKCDKMQLFFQMHRYSVCMALCCLLKCCTQSTRVHERCLFIYLMESTRDHDMEIAKQIVIFFSIA